MAPPEAPIPVGDDDDDDDGDDRALIDLTANTTTTAAAMPAWKQVYTDAAHQGMDALNAIAGKEQRPVKRPRKGKYSKSATTTASSKNLKDNADAIDLCCLDDEDCSSNRKMSAAVVNNATVAASFSLSVATAEASTPPPPDYRQVLGPLRMAFVDTFVTAHSSAHPHYPMHFGPGGGGHRRKKKTAPASASPTTRTTNLQALYKELVEYQLNLPVDANAAIFCRTTETNICQIRCLLTGPMETPYAAGCFFFDVTLHDYPQQAPAVKFLTTGGGRVRFNPNLYQCGKCCLSLLGTWQGPGWKPNVSTLLQVLVSIQGLILVPDPYFNEPSYERERGTARGNQASAAYNRNLYKHTIRYAILEPLQKVDEYYPEFAVAVQRHFSFHRETLKNEIFPAWLKEDPSLKALIQQVSQALDALPALSDATTASQRRKAKRQAAAAAAAVAKEPEMISLIDD